MRARNQGPSVAAMSTVSGDQSSPTHHDAVCVWTCGCCEELLDEEDNVLICRTCGATYDAVTGQYAAAE